MPYLPQILETDSDDERQAELLQKLGPRGPLRHRCAQCSSTGSPLMLCMGCKAVRYCSKEHQVQHRPSHKAVCSKIKKARTKLAKEEDLVRNAQPDFMDPANAFETSVGRFWGILSTRNYMRARFDLTFHLKQVGTLDAVSETASHYRDMLRLCRGDNLGIRSMLPAVLLQLGKDQECYDFVKWWQTEGQRSNYDWGDTSLPYLNVENADVFEAVELFKRDFLDLDQTVAVHLLKLKLLVDIRSMRFCRIVLNGRVPNEIVEKTQAFCLLSTLSENLVTKSTKHLEALEKRLIRQCQQLGGYVCSANFHFWRDFFEFEDYIGQLPAGYTHGSWEQTLLAYQNSYSAWWQTEGVIELLTLADIYAMDRRMKLANVPQEQRDILLADNPAFGPNMQGPVAGGRDMWMYLEDALTEEEALFIRTKGLNSGRWSLNSEIKGR